MSYFASLQGRQFIIGRTTSFKHPTNILMYFFGSMGKLSTFKELLDEIEDVPCDFGLSSIYSLISLASHIYLSVIIMTD